MRLKSFVALGSVLGLMLAACGSDSAGDQPALTLTPDGGKRGTGTGTGTGDDPNISSNQDGGVQGGGELPDQCAADTQQAEQVPVDLYLMVDSSGSMDQETAGGTKKWDDVRDALSAFVDDPASAGLGVGLQFFPLTKGGVPDTCSTDSACGATGGSCWYRRACQSAVPNVKYCATDADCNNVSGDCTDLGQCVGLNTGGLCLSSNNCGLLTTCAKGITGYCKERDSCSAPEYANAKVKIAQLPSHANTLKNELKAKKVDGFTPTAPALQGAIDAAKAQKAANVAHNVAVVLATDGFPTECATTDIPSIANIAATGKSDGVTTYVIGVFSAEEEQEAKTNLNQIASKGGSGAAFVINTTQNVSQAFLQALNTIRGAALPCEYTLPVPKTGNPDYSKVNVQYSSGATKTTIYNVAGAGSCDPTTGGWYYDVDPKTGKPTKVMICPKTCDGFKSDATAKIDIVQGCSTVVK